MIDVEEQLRRYAVAISEPERAERTRPPERSSDEDGAIVRLAAPRRHSPSRWVWAAAVVLLLGLTATLVWRGAGGEELVTTTQDQIVTDVARDENLEVRLIARLTGTGPEARILLTAAVSNIGDRPLPLHDTEALGPKPWPDLRDDRATGPALLSSILRGWPQPVGFTPVDQPVVPTVTQDTSRPGRRMPEAGPQPVVVEPGETVEWQYASVLSAAHPLGSWQVSFQPGVGADLLSHDLELWPTPTATVRLPLPDDRGEQMPLFTAIDALVSDPTVASWAERVLPSRPAGLYFVPQEEQGGWRMDFALTEPGDPGFELVDGQRVVAGRPDEMGHRLRAEVLPGDGAPIVTVIELR